MTRSDPIVTMNVALPASLKAYVGRRVANGEYVSASEYIRELIRVARDTQLNHVLIESETDYVRRLREHEEAKCA